MPPKDRIIFHADMNAYYASVEEIDHPHLRDVPMAICGDPESRRGIILAKNERAKRFGVKTAETIYQAMRKCPGLVLRPARHQLYEEYCEKANAIYVQYTDLLERASIDESYLDVTGTLHLFGGNVEQLAHEIRERIHNELRLTISVGVSYNKFFAKMASDMKKPNAVTIITKENYRSTLWPLPIGDMFMVGKAAEAALLSLNIRTIGDLAQADIRILQRKLGKHGESLRANANGLDETKVLSIDEREIPKSIGRGTTFSHDIVSLDEIRTAITALADSVSARLRKENMKCMTVQLTIKDPNFIVKTRQKGLVQPTWLAAELTAACMELLATHWQMGKPIRLLTVTAMKLVGKDSAVEQMTFFQTPSDDRKRTKKESLEKALDQIRDKFGLESITPASVAFNELGLPRDCEKADIDSEIKPE